MFTRKFERLAASYSDAVFCEILGDENNDTRVRCSPRPPACLHSKQAATGSLHAGNGASWGALGAVSNPRASGSDLCMAIGEENTFARCAGTADALSPLCRG